MKIKETYNGNIKIKLTPQEFALIERVFGELHSGIMNEMGLDSEQQKDTLHIYEEMHDFSGDTFGF
jgi:hypothetical protein